MSAPGADGGLVTLDQIVSLVARLAPDELAKHFVTPYIVVAAPEESLTRDGGTLLGRAGELPAAAGLASPSSPFVLPVARRPGSREAGKRVTVGRSNLCDLVLPFASISKIHAYITESSGSFELEDAWSTNGTRVDGAALAQAGRAQLKDGSEILFGSVLATFWLPATLVASLRKRAGLSL